MFCGCDKFDPKCKELKSLSYYYGDTISCDLFNLPSKNITMQNFTKSKLDKGMLDAYAKFTLTAKSAEVYHLYIEYIYFKLYTNKTSEFEMNVNIEITNVVEESNINSTTNKDTTYTNTYSCIAKENNNAIFKIYVNRTVANANGSIINIDILNSEIYTTNPETTFKWCIYDFKIYGESRAY